MLEKHVPRKKRYLRANYKAFLNSEIVKAIMTRVRFRNCFLKNRNDENRQLFGNKEISLYHCCEKQKKDYFTILNEKHITENKCFWKTVKPFLSNKVQSSERIKTF